MECPHCLKAYHPQTQKTELGGDIDSNWWLYWQTCPSCHKYIIALSERYKSNNAEKWTSLVYPKTISRTPISTHVPSMFADDYKEACLVIVDSPKASAALSRRCLQNILREKAQVKKSDLSREIDELLKSKQLPTHLAEGVDAVRHIGNFATHPIKSTNTGEIVDVEPGEAEWLLDLLEGLFDFYFVQPAELKRKREALDKKLADAGKPPMR